MDCIFLRGRNKEVLMCDVCRSENYKCTQKFDKGKYICDRRRDGNPFTVVNTLECIINIKLTSYPGSITGNGFLGVESKNGQMGGLNCNTFKPTDEDVEIYCEDLFIECPRLKAVGLVIGGV